MWLTDGAGDKSCGLPATNPSGTFTHTYYKQVEDSRATSISLTGAPCASTTCCAIILCTTNNAAGCFGLSYTQKFNEASSGLAAGIVAAIGACGVGEGVYLLSSPPLSF